MPITIERRIDLKLVSKKLLIDYMNLRDMSVRGLAEEVQRELRKAKYKTSKTCSHSTIGHLRSGERTTTSRDIAKAIAEVLNAPLESLFIIQISNVSREISYMAVA